MYIFVLLFLDLTLTSLLLYILIFYIILQEILLLSRFSESYFSVNRLL